MTSGSTSAKPAAGRKPAAKRAPRASRAEVTPPAGVQLSPAAAPGGDGLSLNQWLHDVANTPRRLEVFDRWWEFKQPTGGRAETWDRLVREQGWRAALASMMADEEAAPERTVTVTVPGEEGKPVDKPVVMESLPGSARADEFLEALYELVLPELAAEFWKRFERALFGLGEPSAS
ncbi:hypothetical protein [Blastococcus sp. CCUG 61487]|uniref:hypothetical protein n=1 Tax=Blastococcus sp. CCUG 61487 TaxID=1840703 RepID=UPI0010C149C3|nr:hypothetical protein [Blastococcus sp. CCUG 61487]TKJ25218.1 hypothetical protein A6V29_04135 [Blastococcus sp. CCUG 61487]